MASSADFLYNTYPDEEIPDYLGGQLDTKLALKVQNVCNIKFSKQVCPHFVIDRALFIVFASIHYGLSYNESFCSNGGSNPIEAHFLIAPVIFGEIPNVEPIYLIKVELRYHSFCFSISSLTEM